MVIQIQSKWFSLVLVIGDGGSQEPPLPPTKDETGTQLPVGTEQARTPHIVGFVK